MNTLTKIRIFPTGMRLHEWIAFEAGYMAEELGLRNVLDGEFNTLWWVDAGSERDILRRYFTALARAEAALDRDLARYLPLWRKCIPPEFADRPWGVDRWGAGERFVFEPYPAE